MSRDIICLRGLPVYCINLAKRLDRKIDMYKQFKKYNIKNIEFINAIDYASMDPKLTINKLSKQQSACLYSHILAINTFLNSENDLCLILEDDSDLIALPQIKKPISDTLSKNKNFILQLVHSSRVDNLPVKEITRRNFWNFGCGAYIVDREYANSLLQLFYNKSSIEKNFKQEKIFDKRSNSFFYSDPTAEEIIYFNKQRSYTVPLIKSSISDSDINASNECKIQELVANNYVDKILNSIIDIFNKEKIILL